MGEVFKLNHCYNMDCLPAMELFPDNYFDLAVVDPPYFSGPERRGFYGSKVSKIGVHRDYPVSPAWSKPEPEYFKELFRVCRHYIVCFTWRERKMILEKLHRAINNFNKTFNWRRFRRDALHLGESLLVFGVLYGIFSALIWGVCWLFKINYNPDLIAVAWAVPVLLDTLVKKAYDWNNEVRDWD